MLIEKKDKHPLWSREKLCEWARCEFRLIKAPSRSTITRLMKNKAALLLCRDEKLPKERKRVGKIKIPELDKNLWEWVQDREANGICISGSLIQAKARCLLASIGRENDLRLSNGWLERFKHRHGIRAFVLHGEAYDVDSQAAEDSTPDLLRLTDQYHLNDIYNCDETGLVWASLPTRTLGTKSRSGKKARKQRVTVLLATNSNGTHKMQPYIKMFQWTRTC